MSLSERLNSLSTPEINLAYDFVKGTYPKLLDDGADTRSASAAKSAAILRGAPRGAEREDVEYAPFLKALSEWKHSHEANAYIKALLGTSAATGQAIVPNNFVAEVSEIASTIHPYRQLMNVVTGVRAAAVDVPYEVTGHTAALLQGAYGSNKDIRDFSFGEATATLYTIAQIVDVGNQLLRHSEGAAEQIVRRRLGKALGLAEGNFIMNGTGASQPLGILQAFLAYGDVAAFKTTLSSEPRAATIGRALGALEARGERATGIVTNPTTYWTMATETLGSADEGGWAIDPSGPAGAPRRTLWGVPVFRDVNVPAGTAIVGNWADCDLYLGSEFRIDVSDSAGTRWDSNVTGYRAETELGWTAEPYVRTGKFQKVLGL